jgi:two-component system response regulator GlrR
MKKMVKGFSAPALQKLLSYTWPGNVRELENTIEYAVAMAAQEVVGEDLILQTRVLEEEIPGPLKEAKNHFEKNYLSNILSLSSGNVSKAAKLAGKYRADFYDLLKKHDLNPSAFKKPP